jgi:hypothetical protein
MAKMSFADQATPVVAEPVNETPTDKAEVSNALVPQQNAVANFVEDDDFEGENLGRYATHPYLKLVSKNSKEATVAKFGSGAWVVGDEDKIGSMESPLRVVVIRAAMAWQENLDYAPGVQKRIFRNSAEAHAAGLSTDWDAKRVGRPCATEVLNSLLWVPKPEGMDDLPHVFCYEGPEGEGALVKFFAASTSFSTFGRPILDAKQKFLRSEKGGLVAGYWNLLATAETSKKGLPYLASRMKPATPLNTSEALREFLRKISR